MSKSARPTTSQSAQPRCPVTIGFNPSGQAKPVFCHKWTCPRCKKLLARKWAKRARKHVHQAQETNKGLRQADPSVQVEFFFMLTLTMPGSIRSVAKAFAALPGLWDRVRQRYKRLYGKDVWQYLAFVEGQPERGGMPHFHIITNRPAPLRKKRTKHNLHTWAYKAGFGYQVTEEIVSDQDAARYVAKYASKQHPATPKGFRRVRPSQQWAKLDEKGDKLLVQSFDESLVDFLMRVSLVSGKSMNDLYLDRKDCLDEWDIGLFQDSSRLI